MPLRTEQEVNEELKAYHAQADQIEDDVEAHLQPVYTVDPESGKEVEITEAYIKKVIHGLAKKVIKDFSGGYDLELMSSLNGNIENAKPGIVYLSENPKAYFVKGMDQAIFLPQDQAIDLTNLVEKLNDADFKKNILEITSTAGHTPSGKSILFLGLMDGANFFANEFLSALQALNTALPKEAQIRIHYTATTTSSYEGTERGELKIGELKVEVGGLIVMALDDVLDSGCTLAGLYKELTKRGAAEIYSAVLFNKEYPGRTQEATYSGINVGDAFLLGAGMDLITPYFRLLRTVKAVDKATAPSPQVMKTLKSKIKELNAELREIIFQQQQQQLKASEYSQHILMPPPRARARAPEPESALESALEAASASLIPVLY